LAQDVLPTDARAPSHAVPLEPPSAHVYARLTVLESRIEAAMDGRGTVRDGAANDRFRGLYLHPAEMRELLAAGPSSSVVLEGEGAELLARIEERVDLAEAEGEATPLRRLQRAFGLDATDVELLLLAAAPDLDPRFERFYAYLHDDVSRRRVSVGLAMLLAGLSPMAGPDRARFGPAGALTGFGLVALDEPARPFLARDVRVPDRVVGYLLGDGSPDPAVGSLMVDVVASDMGKADVIARGVAGGARLVYVQERHGASGSSMAAAGLARLGLAAVHLDLRRLPSGPLDLATVRASGREAVLRNGALVARPVEALAERGADAVRAFAELPCCTVLVGARTWDPTWARAVALVVRTQVPTRQERAEHWRRSLNGSAPASFDPGIVAGDLQLTPTQVIDAVTAARQLCTAEGRPLEAEDLRSGARAQNAAGLERLARRVEPCIGWDDLVLPPKVQRLLQELAAQWHHQETVVQQWRIGGATARRRGLTALFSGPPGTGKTMAAEVVAGELGLDLYVINLATVVDKYIGETEKNLERIFSEAEQVNGVLFFDEADALFGRRSEVKDARDRYANIEVAYLLQRMEEFDGIAILATNLKSNVDDAFARRLDASINFPLPEYESRLVLWDKCLGPKVPRADDIDIGFMARSFNFAGGNIRNVAVAAAYYAATRGTELTMADLVRATQREFQKLGRLCVEAEFGPWAQFMESM